MQLADEIGPQREQLQHLLHPRQLARRLRRRGCRFLQNAARLLGVARSIDSV
jgi:hypothetical protein